MGFAPSNLASKKFILKFVELVGYLHQYQKEKFGEKSMKKCSLTGDGVHSDDAIPVGREFTGAGEPCISLGE